MFPLRTSDEMNNPKIVECVDYANKHGCTWEFVSDEHE